MDSSASEDGDLLRYRLLFDHNPDGVFTLDSEGRFTLVNDACQQITGYSSAELLQKSFVDIVAPDCLVEAIGKFQGGLHGPNHEQFETAVIQKGGRRVELWLAGDSIAEDGKVVAVHCTVKDITQRKQNEAALRESEARLAELTRESRVVGWEVDAEGLYTYVSEVALDVWGYRPEELVGKRHFYDIHPDEGREAFQAAAFAVFRSKGHFRDFENPVRHKSGHMVWVITNGLPLQNRDGTLRGYRGADTDITARKRTEEALRKSEERYRLLHESLRDAFVQVDMEGRIDEFNDTYCRMLGYSAEELRRLTYIDLTPARWHDMEAHIVREEILTRGYSNVYEKEYRRKDGSLMPVELRTILSRDSAGIPVAMWAIVRDISERKRAQEALQERQERLQLAMQAANLAEWEINLQTGEVAHSPELLRMFGLGAMEPHQHRDYWRSMVYEDDREIVRQAVENAKHGRAFHIEYRFRHVDGTLRWHDSVATPLADAQGMFTRLVGMIADVTDRKAAEEALRQAKEDLEHRVRDRTSDLMQTVDTLQGEVALLAAAEEALRESELRYRSLVERIPAITYVATAAGSRVPAFISPQVEQVLGYTPEEFLTTSDMWEKIIHPDDHDRVMAEMDLASRSGVFDSEFRIVAKDGRTIWCHDRGTVRRNPDGQTFTVEGVLFDITDLQNVREALRQRGEQLRQLASELTLAEQRERQRLALVLHDDLQQLLVGAKYRLRGLSGSRSEKARQVFAEVDDILTQSLEVSRTLTGELSPPILQHGGLVPALEWLAVWMHRKHGLAVEVRADLDVAPDTEDMKVLLFQAVRELLFNAVKHAGVKAARVDAICEGSSIRITVSDNGRGFAPASLRAKGGDGGGLGLFSIAERLDLLGGCMDIESSPNRGSSITLWAPLRRARATPCAPPQTPVTLVATRGAGAQASAGSGGKIRILLVDDHIVVRQGLARLLTAETDMEVIAEASDGLTAVEFVRQLKPDVVLMDNNMPRMDGVQATRIVHAEHPGVRVIGLSMFEEQERAEVMRQAGAVAYVSKSGPAEQLIETIRQIATVGETT